MNPHDILCSDRYRRSDVHPDPLFPVASREETGRGESEGERHAGIAATHQGITTAAQHFLDSLGEMRRSLKELAYALDEKEARLQALCGVLRH